ncbi:MAG TPA: hypothetical protein VM347_26845 [Nonomuraea sp.]|nr:hypothetical protein [Nonomuraea sp.]
MLAEELHFGHALFSRTPGLVALTLAGRELSRFRLYATDVLRLRPDDFDPDLPEIDFTTLTEAA